MKTKSFAIEMFFKALADQTRLRLINLMRDEEVCVCYFVEVLKANQPKISRHLAYLRRAGVVSARREGKWMHYRLVAPPDPLAARIFSETRRWLAAEKGMRRDREQLLKVCRTTSPPITIQGAPKPARSAANRTAASR